MAPRTITHRFPVGVAPAGAAVPTPVSVSFLPTTWWGWTMTGLLVGIALYAALMFLGMHTGTAGILPVTGNSMGQDVPWGSHVVVAPGGIVRDDDFVVARVGGYKNADDPTDAAPATVIKKYDHGRLVSTADATTYGAGEYTLLGRVVAVLPVQRVFRWLDKGAATPATVRSDEEQVRAKEVGRQAIEACNEAEKAVRKTFIAAGFSPAAVKIPIPGESQEIAGIRGMTLPPDPRLEAVTVGKEMIWAKGDAQIMAPQAVKVDPPLSGRITLQGPATFMDLAAGEVAVTVWTK